MTEEKVAVVEKPRKKIWMSVIMGVVVILAIGAWLGYDYYYNGPCGVKVVDEAIISINDLHDEYFDVVNVAFSIGRENLPGPVMALQDIQRDMSNLEVPTCLIASREMYLNSMGEMISGLTASMEGNTPSEVIITHWDKSVDENSLAKGLILEVLECYPFCN